MPNQTDERDLALGGAGRHEGPPGERRVAAEPHVTVDQRAAAIRLQKSDLARQKSRQPAVVGVEKGDEAAAGRTDRDIARRADAAVGLHHELNPRVEGRDRRLELDRVGRAIVDHDDVEIGERLCEHGGERVRDAGAGAEGRNDDRNSAPRGVRLRHMLLAITS